MLEWSDRSLAAAIGSLQQEDARCPSCGLTDAQAWQFTTVQHHCPSCHDRDDATKALNDGETKPPGVHLRWAGVARSDSAGSMFTPEGAMERALGNN